MSGLKFDFKCALECPKLQAFKKQNLKVVSLYRIMPFANIIGPVKRNRTNM